MKTKKSEKNLLKLFKQRKVSYIIIFGIVFIFVGVICLIYYNNRSIKNKGLPEKHTTNIQQKRGTEESNDYKITQSNDDSSNSGFNSVQKKSSIKIKYSCPNGYIKSEDNQTCTKTVGVKTGYKCPNDYIQSLDGQTCTKRTIVAPVKYLACPVNIYGAWSYEYIESEDTCYFLVTNYEHNKRDCSSVGGRWNESYGFCYSGTSGREYYTKCPDTYDWNDDTSCIKIDKIYSTYTTYCESGYSLSADNNSCYKTIPSIAN